LCDFSFIVKFFDVLVIDSVRNWSIRTEEDIELERDDSDRPVKLNDERSRERISLDNKLPKLSGKEKRYRHNREQNSRNSLIERHAYKTRRVGVSKPGKHPKKIL